MLILREGFSSVGCHCFLISQKLFHFYQWKQWLRLSRLAMWGLSSPSRQEEGCAPHRPSPRKHQYEEGISSELDLRYTQPISQEYHRKQRNAK